MIGEFEEEIVKLSDAMAKQSLNGTLKRISTNLNEMSNGDNIDSELSSIEIEAKSLELTLANLKKASNQALGDLHNDCSQTLDVFSNSDDCMGKALSSLENDLNMSVQRKNNLVKELIIVD